MIALYVALVLVILGMALVGVMVRWCGSDALSMDHPTDDAVSTIDRLDGVRQ